MPAPESTTRPALALVVTLLAQMAGSLCLSMPSVLAPAVAPTLGFAADRVGLFIGIAGRAIVRSLITVNVSVIDPWMLLIVPMPLLLAAFCACYLPARRASRVDPNVALRQL